MQWSGSVGSLTRHFLVGLGVGVGVGELEVVSGGVGVGDAEVVCGGVECDVVDGGVECAVVCGRELLVEPSGVEGAAAVLPTPLVGG
jgi:hypothetical protein